jgi:peptidoglycan/LPS O-acetylase OafA/YrhL
MLHRALLRRVLRWATCPRSTGCGESPSPPSSRTTLDFGWAQGGYLGVSLFFTLSGYLISRLMMGEVERTGRVAVGAFWRRRIKRLAPASMVTLTSIVALEHLDPSIWSTTGFRSSMFGALFHVANWEALISGTGYFDLLGVASPVRHYWSLAIEEQFYLVFPLVVLVLIGSQRKRIDRLVPLAIVGIAISTVLTLLLSSNPERVYLGTDTRMAEILFGVLFGALHHRLGDRLGRRAASLALPALAIFILAVITLPASSPIISHGGLIVGGGIWAVLIVGSGPRRAHVPRRPGRHPGGPNRCRTWAASAMPCT